MAVLRQLQQLATTHLNQSPLSRRDFETEAASKQGLGELLQIVYKSYETPTDQQGKLDLIMLLLTNTHMNGLDSDEVSPWEPHKRSFQNLLQSFIANSVLENSLEVLIFLLTVSPLAEPHELLQPLNEVAGSKLNIRVWDRLPGNRLKHHSPFMSDYVDMVRDTVGIQHWSHEDPHRPHTALFHQFWKTFQRSQQAVSDMVQASKESFEDIILSAVASKFADVLVRFEEEASLLPSWKCGSLQRIHQMTEIMNFIETLFACKNVSDLLERFDRHRYIEVSETAELWNLTLTSLKAAAEDCFWQNGAIELLTYADNISGFHAPEFRIFDKSDILTIALETDTVFRSLQIAGTKPIVLMDFEGETDIRDSFENLHKFKLERCRLRMKHDQKAGSADYSALPIRQIVSIHNRYLQFEIMHHYIYECKISETFSALMDIVLFRQDYFTDVLCRNILQESPIFQADGKLKLTQTHSRKAAVKLDEIINTSSNGFHGILEFMKWKSDATGSFAVLFQPACKLSLIFSHEILQTINDAFRHMFFIRISIKKLELDLLLGLKMQNVNSAESNVKRTALEVLRNYITDVKSRIYFNMISQTNARIRGIQNEVSTWMETGEASSLTYTAFSDILNDICVCLRESSLSENHTFRTALESLLSTICSESDNCNLLSEKLNGWLKVKENQ